MHLEIPLLCSSIGKRVIFDFHVLIGRAEQRDADQSSWFEDEVSTFRSAVRRMEESLRQATEKQKVAFRREFAAKIVRFMNSVCEHSLFCEHVDFVKTMRSFMYTSASN